MIIDFHVHAFAAKVAEKAVSAIELESGVKPYTRGLVGQLMYRMDEWGIDRACLLSVATKPQQQRVINDWAAGLAGDAGRDALCDRSAAEAHLLLSDPGGGGATAFGRLRGLRRRAAGAGLRRAGLLEKHQHANMTHI